MGTEGRVNGGTQDHHYHQGTYKFCLHLRIHPPTPYQPREQLGCLNNGREGGQSLLSVDIRCAPPSFGSEPRAHQRGVVLA